MRKVLQCCNCPHWLVTHLTKPTYEDVKLAIYRQEIDKIEQLLHKGAPTHQKGENILHFAVTQNKQQAVEFISEHYYELIDEKNDDGDTPFMLSLFGGHQKITKYLFDVSSMGIRDNKGNTALIIAAANGNIVALQKIMEFPCTNVMIKNYEGQTALHRAAFYGQVEAVKFLLRKTKLKLAQADKNDNNSLHFACMGGSLVCARYMLLKVKSPELLLRAVNKDGLKPIEVLEDAVRKANSIQKSDKKGIRIDQILKYIFQDLNVDPYGGEEDVLT